VTAPPVLLDEVIFRLGGSREAADTWLRKLRVTPELDWAGRQTIPADAAERIVDSYRRAQTEHAEAVSAYDAYVRDRERRLVEAGDQAYRETAERELAAQYDTKFANDPVGRRGFAEGGVTFSTRLGLWPPGRARAREAALEAREEFERREPLMRFDEWSMKWRK
jgi:hypothetical protein